MTRRKRLAIIIALGLICVLSLSACASVPVPITVGSSIEATAEAATNTVQGLVVLDSIAISKISSQRIMYDPETKVMYVLIVNGEGAAMSPLYNSDGTLKLYNH